jgi:hypothetical protein
VVRPIEKIDFNEENYKNNTLCYEPVWHVVLFVPFAPVSELKGSGLYRMA